MLKFSENVELYRPGRLAYRDKSAMDLYVWLLPVPHIWDRQSFWCRAIPIGIRFGRNRNGVKSTRWRRFPYVTGFLRCVWMQRAMARYRYTDATCRETPKNWTLFSKLWSPICILQLLVIQCKFIFVLLF